jgi:hypothetical protein
LMRRIHMLRAKEGVSNQPLAWRGRMIAVGLLFAAALGASALRAPSRSVAADKPENKAAKTSTATKSSTVSEREPFDLTYVAKQDSFSIYAVRPAEILRLPGMKKWADKMNKGIAELYKEAFKGDGELGLRFEDIDQLIGHSSIKTDPKLKDN